MVCCIHIHNFINHRDIALLDKKLQKLDERYGYLMSFDSEYHKTMQRLNFFIKSQRMEQELKINQATELKRSILVLELPQFKNNPQLDARDPVD